MEHLGGYLRGIGDALNSSLQLFKKVPTSISSRATAAFKKGLTARTDAEQKGAQRKDIKATQGESKALLSVNPLHPKKETTGPTPFSSAARYEPSPTKPLEVTLANSIESLEKPKEKENLSSLKKETSRFEDAPQFHAGIKESEAEGRLTKPGSAIFYKLDSRFGAKYKILINIDNNIKSFTLNPSKSFEENIKGIEEKLGKVHFIYPKEDAEEQRLELKSAEEKGKYEQPIYDRQVVLNMGLPSNGLALNKRAKQSGSVAADKMDDLYLPALEEGIGKKNKYEDYEQFRSLTGSSKVYIIGHCKPGADSIGAEYAGGRKSIDDFIEIFKKVPDLANTTSSEKKIKISLVACWAGLESTESKSFAQKLSEGLAKEGIHAEVVARTEAIEKKETARGGMRIKTSPNKETPAESKRPGTKVSFYTDPVTKGTTKTQVY